LPPAQSPWHITLADGRRLALRDDAAAVLGLLAAPRIDTREVFAVGRRLFEAGGLEPLEAILDAVTGRLGHDVAAELMMIWMPVIAGEDLAA
jgi:hypothetical protein